MQLGNSSERWGAVAQFMHWTVVLLIITQFTLASIAEDLPLGMQKLAWIARHKSVGITILGIAALRLAWRLYSPGPPLPARLKPWERVLAHLTHYGLYFLLFAMPLSGWLMSSAKGYPVSWFNLLQLPDLIGKDEQAFELLHECHELLAGTLVVLAVLHVAGALKHHFYYKDAVLRRMLPCLAGAALLALAAGPVQVTAAELVADPAGSELRFTFTQAGGLNSGHFRTFDVRLAEADGELAGGTLQVTIDPASLDTGDAERDEILRGAELFDTARFPQATFRAATIQPDGSGGFVADGRLTIRDQTRSLRLPLAARRATEEGVEVTYLNGEAAIDRLDYGVGQGEWASTEWVANRVTISWSVRLLPVTD